MSTNSAIRNCQLPKNTLRHLSDGDYPPGICSPTVAVPFNLPSGQDDKILSWMKRIGIEV